MTLRPLHVYSASFVRNRRYRRMLSLAGWQVRTAWPHRDAHVGVWGQRHVAWRGRAVSRLSGARLVTVEDGFLRSVHPGNGGEPPLSLVIDDIGIFFDASRASRLERLIAQSPIDVGRDERARAGIAALRAAGLSKYTPIARAETPVSEPGYVLVIDQTRNDASITGAGADAGTFAEMLAAARADNPGAQILIRAHPDTRSGRKQGHFSHSDLLPGERLLDAPANPWDVIEGASRVYTVSSQMGFEAVMAGKPVSCFGLPFYAGWGLTDDRRASPRRGMARSLEQVFAAAYFDYPIYYDPYHDCLTNFEQTVATLTTLARHRGISPTGERLVLSGFRAWKRQHCLRFAANYRHPPEFIDDADKAIETAAEQRADLWLWASKAAPDMADRARARGIAVANVEDGFIRSVGLGAALTAPASLVFDDLGIYYDPAQPSRLETLIAEAAALAPDSPEIRRARELAERIVDQQVSKYNQGAAPSISLPKGRRILLVPGQVEDDASIRRGTREVATNLDLLRRTREDNPDAFIIYKPHPDVEAGLRTGAVPAADLGHLTDHVAHQADPARLIALADEIWTMTSLMGFEALLRGKHVTCFGLPFYAGWGLTKDKWPCPRRVARPSLDALVWASLIAYPCYVDPVSKLPCEVELVVERLASRNLPSPSPKDRLLSKLQGYLAGRGMIFWR
ncbi:capsular polysaccharide biosynthesis protein [Rhodobacteraceae bacterium NNCM2]|nr:capsular polysaccharide biosynthesis protein [Coraliihabitans acroporae]